MMEDDPRTSSLRRKVRESARRRQAAELTKHLAVAIDVPEASIYPLPLNEADAIRQRLYERVANCSDCWRQEGIDLPVISTHLRKLADFVDADLILLTDTYPDVGAVAAPPKPLLYHAVAAWEVVGVDLAIGTRGLDSGLCIERVYYLGTGESRPDGVLTATGWGALVPSAGDPAE